MLFRSATSRAVLACALVISPAFGSYPKFKDYQPQNDVRVEARIDLDLDEILAKLVADDVDGAMTIYREGGSLVSLTPPTLQSISKPDTDNIMALDTWFPEYKAYWNQQINYADWFVETAAASTYQSATKKELIKNLDSLYSQLQREHQISPGDFPDLAKMQESLVSGEHH